MYTTSDAFKQAIADGEPQKPLIIFDDGTVLSGYDIQLSGGMKLTQSVMETEDYEPGACTASTLSFTVLNEDNRFSEFEWGQCTAYVGVYTASGSYTSGNELCYAEIDGHILRGNASKPYFTCDGSTYTSALLDGPVQAFYIVNSTIYFILADEIVSCTYASTGTRFSDYASGTTVGWSISKTADELRKTHESVVIGWDADTGTAPDGSMNAVHFTGGKKYAWEFCPLGVFVIDEPEYSSGGTISLTGNDLMSKFDTETDTSQVTFSGGPTLLGLLKMLCKQAGVTLSNTSIVNGTITCPSDYDASGTTLRTLLRYVCQASGTFARMTRDGKLELAWFTESGITLTPDRYVEYSRQFKNVCPIDNVILRESSWDSDIRYPSGTFIGAGHLYIEDNPLFLSEDTTSGEGVDIDEDTST